MVTLVRSASTTAELAISADCVTRREISLVEACNCSVAAATVCTLDEACSDAVATAAACLVGFSAVAGMLPGVGIYLFRTPRDALVAAPNPPSPYTDVHSH